MQRIIRPYCLATFASVALATSAAQAAVIIVTTDTATDYSGSFLATGIDFTSASPSLFSALPFGSTQLYLSRTPGAPGNDTFKSFGGGGGTPDDPAYVGSQAAVPPTLSGTYSNGGAGADTTVNWSFSGMVDSDPGNNISGTFSGTFSFSVVAVPEPTETAVAIGLGLGAFAMVRRSRGDSSIAR